MDEKAKERSQIKRHLRRLEEDDVRRKAIGLAESGASQAEIDLALRLIESERKKLLARLAELGE